MRFSRLDHIVLQVPEIEAAHARLLGLGFTEAWPIGRTWSIGSTSGIALGGINLELLQPDEEPPATPALAELVFEPEQGVPLQSYGRVVEKIEADPAKLAARGFPPSMTERPQRICTNAFPGPESPWPHFVCDYAPFLADRLGPASFPNPFGLVRRIEIGPLQLPPRFVAGPPKPDLTRFLDDNVLTSGPELQAGNDRVVYGSGKALDLVHLIIEDDQTSGT